MIKAIIFDIGGVLIPEHMSLQIKSFARHFNINPEIVFALSDKYSKELMTGELPLKKFLLMVKKNSGLKVTVPELLKVWQNKYVEILGLNEEIISFAKSLKPKYKIAILSNLSDESYKINKKRGLFKDFDASVVSCVVKMRKPDSKIFKLITAKLKVKPDECIFVDDHPGNVLSANDLGFNTIHYSNMAHFYDSLRTLGVSF